MENRIHNCIATIGIHSNFYVNASKVGEESILKFLRRKFFANVKIEKKSF